MLRTLISHRIIAVLCIFMLSGLGLALAESHKATKAEKALYQQMRRLEVQIIRLNEHVRETRSFRQPGVSWEGYTWELNEAADAANEISDLIPKLFKTQEKVDWQKQALDRIAAKSTAISSHLQKAIETVNEKQDATRLLIDSEFQKRLDAMAVLSEDVEDTIDYLQARYNYEIKKKYESMS